MAAYKKESSLKNENIVMVLDGDKDRVVVRQVAGFLARRAVCRVKPGDTLRRGERYGIIKFSSRLDVYLPKDIPSYSPLLAHNLEDPGSIPGADGDNLGMSPFTCSPCSPSSE